MAKKSEKLSVGLVFDDSLDSSDGVAQYVKTLGAWLSAEGHEVSYLVGETKLKSWAGGEVYSLAKNLTVYFNGNKLSIPLPAPNRPIAAVLENSFDVLHVMVPYSPFMSQKVIKAAGPGTAIVGTFHIFPSGRLARFGARFLRLLYGRSLGRFYKIVAVSQAASTFAKSAFGVSCGIIPNPVDIGSFEIETSKDTQAQQVVFLGRLVKRKGCLELLKAFKLLTEQIPSAELVVAGDGPLRPRLEKYVKKAGLSHRVRFLGFIKESDKANLLNSADIACFPSLYGESFGIVLIEAMAAGAGVVLGGDNPGYRTVLGDQPKLLINPRDSTAFAARLEGLLTNRPVIDGLHAWQAEEVRQYDIALVGNQILQLYRSAIADLSETSNNKAHEFRPKGDS